MSLKLVTPPTTEPLTIAEVYGHLRVDDPPDIILIDNLIAAAREYCEGFQGRAYVRQTWRLSLDGFPSGAIVLPRPPLMSVASIQYVDSAGVTQSLLASDYQVDAESEPGRVLPAYGQSWPAARDQTNAVTVTYFAGYGSDGVAGETTFQFLFRVNEVLTNATSVLMSDPTGTYGARRTDTLGVVVSDGEPMTNMDPGVYEKTIDDPAAGLTYQWYAEVLFNGVTNRYPFTQVGGGSGAKVPQTVKHAMNLLIAHWYEHREAVLTGTISKEILAVKALLWLDRIVQF